MRERQRNTPPPWDPAIPFWDWPTFGRSRAAAAEEDYEERAAILEYEAGLERGAAELQAYRMTLERWS